MKYSRGPYDARGKLVPFYTGNLSIPQAAIRVLFACLPALLTVTGCARQSREAPGDPAQAPAPAILIDLHNDVTSQTVKGLDIGVRRAQGHTDLPRLREGNLGAVFFSAYVSRQFEERGQSAHRVLEMIDTIRHDIVERYPDDFLLAVSADDIERAHREGKIAALIGIEGGHAIEKSLRLLRAYHALGVRYMTLTHSFTNGLGDSSGDASKSGVRHHGGLSDLGREVVREMNRLGMMVDVSHVSDETFWDVIEVSSAPVMASHSSCRAIADIPRNMTDAMIQAMAKKGGVIHINFGCEFVSPKSAAFNPTLDYERSKVTPPASVDDVVAHIDHVVKIAGVEAVGLGSDFDGIECVPTGLEDVSKFPNLIEALRTRGYSNEDIGKIAGGNTLRLMRAVERAAAVR